MGDSIADHRESDLDYEVKVGSTGMRWTICSVKWNITRLNKREIKEWGVGGPIWDPSLFLSMHSLTPTSALFLSQIYTQTLVFFRATHVHAVVRAVSNLDLTLPPKVGVRPTHRPTL